MQGATDGRIGPNVQGECRDLWTAKPIRILKLGIGDPQTAGKPIRILKLTIRDPRTTKMVRISKFVKQGSMGRQIGPYFDIERRGFTNRQIGPYFQIGRRDSCTTELIRILRE